MKYFGYLVPLLFAAAGSTKISVESRMLQVGQSCFQFESDLLSWTAHKGLAQSMGCSLASIVSEQESVQAEAILLAADSFSGLVWIGGRSIGIPGLRGPTNWAWDDGRAWNYERFDEGEPNNLNLNGGDEIRLALYEGYWQDLVPEIPLPALYKCPCLFPTLSPTQEICEFEISLDQLSWTDHEASAVSKSCNLASIVNMAESNVVVSLLENAGLSNGFVWLGGHLRENVLLAEPGPENWEWSDGANYEFESWKQGEPNGLNLNAMASYAISVKDGMWFDVVESVQIPAVYKCDCGGAPSRLLPV